MKAKFYIFISLLFLFFQSSAQWVGLGNGVDVQCKCLKADSIHNYIYLGGNFHYADSIRCNSVARWDGQHWDSLSSGANFGSPVFCLNIYHDTLFAGSMFSSSLNTGLAKWNGVSWDTMQVNACVNSMKIYNGELFMGGPFTQSGGVNVSLITKWNGNSFTGFPFSFPWFSIYAIEFFAGELYMGGNFYYGPGMNDLCKWDGTTMQSIGGGIVGGNGQVQCMTIYKNELYIGGYFSKPGNVGDYIMKWDGNTLTEVGNGMDQQVIDMKVYNDELYVVGGFDHAGGITAHRIAKWDGTSWHNVGNSIFDNNIEALEFLNNELYIAGGFRYVDGVNLHYVAKYTGQLGTGDYLKPSLNFFLTPNPSTSASINISFLPSLSEDALLSATDITGKKQFEILIARETAKKEIDISELAQGVYFLTLQTKNGVVIRKLLKE
jgi:hypothetical protein